MITINKNSDRSTINSLELFGLSSDEKPIDKFNGTDITNGSSYLEMDTGMKYLYDAENKEWIYGGN